MRGSLTFGVRALASALMLCAACLAAAGQQQPAPAQGAQPAVDEWRDDFDGDKLDETKWERYTFEGGGGKAEVKEKQLRLRGGEGSRSGVRSRQSFGGERFLVQAQLTKVGERAPDSGEQGMQAGTGILTVLFGGSTSNRVEWLLRSDGIFEAWLSVDGRMERIDNRQLATKAKSLWLGIGRRGDQIFFMVNDKVALEHTARGLPSNFKVMLYGFGTTENSWDAISVQTLKQQ
ncbi:MAG: hypothetical protein JOZ02_11345 [Acidobacteria bacterium]|nr:hypothetical protein [Acidobacteriota bacterium]